MYNVLTVSDIVRVPPSYFTMDLKDAIELIIKEKYERKVDLKNGVVLKIWNVHDVDGGTVILGDGASYYNIKYNALVFRPEVHEVIESEVVEVMDFGVFVSLGPFDGLIHLSQITNEYISFDRKAGVLISKATKKTLKKGDIVRAKVVTVSLKSTIPETRIALTMKGEGLGKAEWIEEMEKERGKMVKPKKKEIGKRGKRSEGKKRKGKKR